MFGHKKCPKISPRWKISESTTQQLPKPNVVERRRREKFFVFQNLTHASTYKGAPKRLARCVPPPAPSFDHRQLQQPQQPAKGKENPRIWGRLLGSSSSHKYSGGKGPNRKAVTRTEQALRACAVPVCISAALGRLRRRGEGFSGRPAAARGARGSTSPPPPPRAHTRSEHRVSALRAVHRAGAMLNAAVAVMPTATAPWNGATVLTADSVVAANRVQTYVASSYGVSFSAPKTKRQFSPGLFRRRRCGGGRVSPHQPLIYSPELCVSLCGLICIREMSAFSLRVRTTATAAGSRR
jgi:hypothetical protein